MTSVILEFVGWPVLLVDLRRKIYGIQHLFFWSFQLCWSFDPPPAVFHVEKPTERIKEENADDPLENSKTTAKIWGLHCQHSRFVSHDMTSDESDSNGNGNGNTTGKCIKQQSKFCSPQPSRQWWQWLQFLWWWWRWWRWQWWWQLRLEMVMAMGNGDGYGQWQWAMAMGNGNGNDQTDRNCNGDGEFCSDELFCQFVQSMAASRKTKPQWFRVAVVLVLATLLLHNEQRQVLKVATEEKERFYQGQWDHLCCHRAATANSLQEKKF